MSLQEEIAELLPWEIHATRIKLGISDKIINKVLDAAVEALYREMIPTGLHEAHDMALKKGVEAINKLRGE